MRFEKPLIKGIIHKRYKRFLADVLLENGEMITAHVPNTGSMKGCWAKDWPVLLSLSENKKRKLPYTLEMSFNGKTWIGLNTSRTNKIVEEALQTQSIPELLYPEIIREQKILDSRIDFLAKNEREHCYIEVKNVTLAQDQLALFPDAITTRGQKHLETLIKIKEMGHRSVLFFLVQREDVNQFSPAKEIDPIYAKLLSLAKQNGVEVFCYQCEMSKDQTPIKRKLPILL